MGRTAQNRTDTERGGLTREAAAALVPGARTGMIRDPRTETGMVASPRVIEQARIIGISVNTR